jgi:hypothetical protein
LTTPTINTPSISSPTITGTTTVGTVAPTSQIPFAINSGSVQIVFGNTFSASASVTFASSRFTQAPLVFLTVTGNTSGNGRTMIARAHSVTSTGFTLLGDLDGIATVGIVVNWFAIQMTSSASAG